jgi:hypothetical protein
MIQLLAMPVQGSRRLSTANDRCWDRSIAGGRTGKAVVSRHSIGKSRTTILQLFVTERCQAAQRPRTAQTIDLISFMPRLANQGRGEMNRPGIAGVCLSYPHRS